MRGKAAHIILYTLVGIALAILFLNRVFDLGLPVTDAARYWYGAD